MNIDKVIRQLRTKYPGKQIIKNKNIDGKVTEIICEIDPTENHPDYSFSIAVVDQSVLHVHKRLKETYKVTKGSLTVFMSDRNICLKKGNELTMEPGEIHANLGKETWITVYSKPGWILEDHIGLKPIVKEYLSKH